jgi:hypothetical protein
MLLICYVLKYVTIHGINCEIFCTDVKKNYIFKNIYFTFPVKIFETDAVTYIRL